jgi:CMP/dCMP kinase
MTGSGVRVVTIDGPSGSGKGTIGRLLAQKLGWHYLDSGALYRLVALAGLRRHVDFADRAALAEIAATLNARFATAAGGERVYLDGDDVNEELRTERAGDAASKVAAIPEVRTALLKRQRDYALAPGLVADGRDMGTVVFPDALLKVVLTASAEA